jgi:dihydroxy-acid dehydratase
LIAYAGRLGIDLPLSRFDELCRTTPWLVDLKPAGEHLMEDFYYAGGLPAVLEQIRDLLHLDVLTVTGRTLGENLDSAPTAIVDEQVIRPRAKPLDEGGSVVVLHGSLCPDGAVIKISAADPRLLEHEGRAVVFEGIDDLAARVDDPDLEVDADSVLVLRNAGPVGAPGMPEWGHLPIPAKLLKSGVSDLVRISDARMSGTSYGAVVLHVAPEAAVGGPLALVETGDWIRLDVEARTLDLLVDEAELERRRAAWSPPARKDERGYRRLYEDHVLQANQGCDFDFLRGRSAVVTDAVTYL